MGKFLLKLVVGLMMLEALALGAVALWVVGTQGVNCECGSALRLNVAPIMPIKTTKAKGR